VVAPQSVLFLEDVSPSDDEEVIRDAIEDAIYKTMRNPPDFETRVMDDGYGLVIVGQAAVVTGEKLEEDDLENGKMNFRLALFLRNCVFGICEEAEPIAVAFAD
jgi:hypothetical protein